MLCVSSVQGNCSPWLQYFTHIRSKCVRMWRSIPEMLTHLFRARELLPLVAIFYELSLQKCYAFLPCKGIAPLGRNILRIVTTEMLRVSSVTILKFLSASAGAGVVAAYFGHCAHYGYVLTLPAALHC